MTAYTITPSKHSKGKEEAAPHQIMLTFTSCLSTQVECARTI